MTWIRRLLAGGSTGNDHLTAAVAAVLLLLLAVEGATLLRLQPLLTVHAFVGMLLIPVVALKFASTGWRMLRYYGGGDEYVGQGPPPLFLRALIAPVLIVSTSCCSRPVPHYSLSIRPEGLLSACTRRASLSGSAQPRSTYWRTSGSCLAACEIELKGLASG